MFEEDVVYIGDEQDVALWRAHLLMFFFTLQLLFDASPVGRRGLERVLQCVCPPFASLPLYPPCGMEAAGAVVRGLVERARLASQPERLRSLVVETGEFQEQIRKHFRQELFSLSTAQLLEVLDSDSSGEITLEEFVGALQLLPAQGVLRIGDIEHDVLYDMIHDLAVELFDEIDVDGNGSLTRDELKNAIITDQKIAIGTDRAQWSFVKRFTHYLYRNIPGTHAYREVQFQERERVEKIRAEYNEFRAIQQKRIDHDRKLAELSAEISLVV